MRRQKSHNEPQRPANHPPTGTRTATACPACRKEQMWCPSGVVCSDFESCSGDASENQGRPSDIPFPAAETDQGESLDEVLDELPKERPKARRRPVASSAIRDRDTLSLGNMGRIVERVFEFDLDDADKRVSEFIAPGDDRRLDFGLLQIELDRSTEMAILAHRLFTNARETCENFEIDSDLILSSMRDAARYKLEEDKRQGIRSKPVTDADVLGMMKMQDPARWRDLKIKAIRMEAAKDHLERIADLARKRIDILKTLVEKRS